MQRYLDIVEAVLEESLSAHSRPRDLADAMRHAIMAGGKRIRPVICLAAAEAVGGTAEDAKYAACAIELLHNYTLVHDDLPSMDNDRERRGKPTVWAKYGESIPSAEEISGEFALSFATKGSLFPVSIPLLIFHLTKTL